MSEKTENKKIEKPIEDKIEDLEKAVVTNEAPEVDLDPKTWR